MKKTTKAVPEDMYMVHEGDMMRVYVDEVAVTTFTLPSIRIHFSMSLLCILSNVNIYFCLCKCLIDQKIYA